MTRATLVLCALGLLPWALHGLEPAAGTAFSAEIVRLSEPPGTFDTDNLISNERSYLDVAPALATATVAGGVYIGVGPDQNFSYIARTRPAVAYILDVRRDNLLLHFLFKALFARAPTRIEYLSLLTGRAPPPDPTRFRAASIAELVAHIDGRQPGEAAVRLLLRQVDQAVTSYGLPLTAADRQTVTRFHRAFITRGLDLQFQSHGRPPRAHYPTLRDLLTASDRSGRQWNFLASEDDYQFVRGLQARDAIIPVVGNVVGSHALPAIAATMRERRQTLSALYISNVEDYLFRDGTFAHYAANVARLPRTSRSVVIRSIFGGGGSASVVQPADEFVAGAQVGHYRTYWDLASRY